MKFKGVIVIAVIAILANYVYGKWIAPMIGPKA